MSLTRHQCEKRFVRAEALQPSKAPINKMRGVFGIQTLKQSGMLDTSRDTFALKKSAEIPTPFRG